MPESSRSSILPRVTAAALAGLLAAGVAVAGAGAISVSLKNPGLHVAGIVFYSATLARGDKPEELVIRHGDLDLVEWRPGTLPTIDAHVLVANTTPLKIGSVSVQVSIYIGEASGVDPPAADKISPGAPRIVEKLFFERTFSLENVSRGALGRVAVRDIQMAEHMKDLGRQKIWPAYVRVEATLKDLPHGVEAIRPNNSAFLKIVPGR